MSPKCTSWLGHKYEGRYSEEIPGGFEAKRITTTAIVALRSKTYERDICVRCGHVVEKKP